MNPVEEGKTMRGISYDPLWKKLVDVKLNRTELAEKAGFSRGTITKMGKNEAVGLDVILKICNYLDCGIEDVVSILPAEQ
jgi:DNA (cytosine-5)-methyltransferase 1